MWAALFKDSDHQPMDSFEVFLPPPVSKAMWLNDVPQYCSITSFSTPYVMNDSLEPRCSPAPASAVTSKVQAGPVYVAVAPDVTVAATAIATAAAFGVAFGAAAALAFPALP